MLSFPKALGRAHKGASMAEYGILLGLLGTTSAFLVLNFSTIFLELFEESTTLQKTAYVFAQTQEAGRITIQSGAPTAGTVGISYNWEAAQDILQEGFFESGAPTWQATGLPPGLGIDTTTGTVSGTPTTPGSFSTTITATRGEAQDTTTAVFLVAP